MIEPLSEVLAKQQNRALYKAQFISHKNYEDALNKKTWESVDSIIFLTLKYLCDLSNGLTLPWYKRAACKLVAKVIKDDLDLWRETRS